MPRDAQGREFTPGLDGVRVRSADYLAAGDLRVLRSVPLPLAPTWLPTEVLDRRPVLKVIDGGPGYALVWERSLAGGGSELGLSLILYPAHELDRQAFLPGAWPGDGTVDVAGSPGFIEHGYSESVTWLADGRFVVRVDGSPGLDHRLNCEELLAIARSTVVA